MLVGQQGRGHEVHAPSPPSSTSSASASRTRSRPRTARASATWSRRRSTSPSPRQPEEDDGRESGRRGVKLAVVGRPNVGKSTLINAWLGEERLVAFDQPGTTRDAIDVPFERDGKRYTLIDTAGLRRRGKVFEAIEKFSVVKTLQAIARRERRDAAARRARRASPSRTRTSPATSSSRAARWWWRVNKWDAVDRTSASASSATSSASCRSSKFARFHFISALKAPGIGPLLKAIDEAYASAMAKMPTPVLTRALQEAVRASSQARRRGSVRPKLRYAHQGGMNPPIIVIHGNSLEHVTDAYKRFLEGRFRETFQADGTPLRIEMQHRRRTRYADKGPRTRVRAGFGAPAQALAQKSKIGCSVTVDGGSLCSSSIRQPATTNTEHTMSNKGQLLQDPFLNTLRKEHVPVSIYLVNGIKLQGHIESFDQYVVLLRNTVTQMVYKHAISTVVPAAPVNFHPDAEQS